MVKYALFLLVVVGLVMLVLSNLSPISLAFLGVRTLDLPLGVWLVGAIAAGALTTLAISGLVGLARPIAPSGRRYPPRSPSTSQFSSQPSRPWTAWTKRQESPSPRSTATSGATGNRYTSAASHGGDDWSTTSRQSDEWEDWGGYTERHQPESTVQSDLRDTEDDAWANWEGYEDLERGSDAENIVDRPPHRPPQPQHTDFEVRQEPETRSQSGSVYSFSYRKSDQPQPTKPAKPGGVYDAEYRVLMPPFHPGPEDAPPASPTPPISDDEDWGLDDEFEPQRSTQRSEDEFDEFDDEFDDEFGPTDRPDRPSQT